VKAKARSSIRTHKSGLGLQVRLQSNCITLVQKGFGLLRAHSEMGLLVGFKLRLARSNCFA
jgi:hypothetical protein